MIAHVSIPADDCEFVAKVLAEIMQGGALRFPPGGPNAWNAWSKQAEIQIVVTPRGAYMVPGEHEMAWEQLPNSQRASETHFALCVERNAEEVAELARRAGWLTRICDRGGFFHVVEIWIENAYLLEVLDPVYAKEYQRSMTVENWTRAFARA